MNQGNLTEPGIIALLLFIKCQAQQKGLNQIVLREPLFGAQNMGIGRGHGFEFGQCMWGEGRIGWRGVTE